ncbi:MAG: helix-turn-helix transcriptional regulator [Victivallaceae bacterium]|nr:helix-turn-helix transcriptional regulator [Victivallaceae bacterium]
MNFNLKVNSKRRMLVPVEQRLPLNVRSAGHAFIEPGWLHAAGVVDRYNIYWGIAGESSYSVNGHYFTMHRDELIIFPLNSRMGCGEQTTSGEYRWFTLDGAMASELFSQLKLNFFTPVIARCPVHLHEKLLHSFDDLTAVAALNAEFIAYELLLSIKNSYDANNRDDEILIVKQIIDSEFTDCYLDITAVAERVGIDRTALARRFKANNGIAPSKYLQSKRLMLALRYLESGCSTVTTAQQTGYNDAGYFARSFKRNFGMSPQSWRESIANSV